MATTLQNIMTTLRGANILPAAQINYGLSDNLQPPYVALDAYEFTQEYDSCKAEIRKSTFHVIVVAKDADSVQTTAQAFFALLDTSTTLTPQTMRCYLTRYKIGQALEGNTGLYQWIVDTEWELLESL